ncbi:TonB-dependent receptor [Marinicauda algicola]|uniref:TonB-dependent receptor n=1 Tax=Marinicauda algicola TaxID=2029849 RepID=A0A4S2GXN4_9PROT|nr:TonB-dependent receptor [Marinicauda algicola]TGY87824.1 TonB-dependent receptor [Marinicauda algicola]
MSFKSTILGASALATSLSLFAVGAPAAFAQDAEPEAVEESRGDVITVTARRREERLVDVPVSVTAFSGEQLLDLGAQDITFLGNVTPNTTLEVSRGTNSTLTAFIRGVGQQDPVAGFEGGVGVYIDDVYMNRPQAAVLEVYDVERVEVLRGPQGTLYGRNTIGGAVKYVTRSLSDEPEFTARVNVGSYNQFDTIVHGSAPLADTVRVGGAVARFSREGFGTNLYQGIENYNKDIWAARASAEFDLTPDFQVRISGDYTLDNSNPRQGHRLIADRFPPFTYPVLDDEYDTRAGLDFPEQQVEAYGGQITAEWNFSDRVTFKSVTGYREDESTTPIDFDSLPEADLDVPAIYENDQFSQELQMLYEGDRLSGVMGFYYLDANSSTIFDVILGTTGALIGLPGLNAQTFGDVSTETWSVFGDFTYEVTDRLNVSLGGRFTSDERSSIVRRQLLLGGASDFFGGPGFPIAVTSNFQGSEEWDDFSPRFSLAYDVTDSSNVYFTYSQGFKGGSFDPRGQTSAAPDFDGDGTVSADEVFEFMKFEPEEVNSYEAGWKADWGNWRHSLAAFYTDYTDVQIPGSVGVDTDGDGVSDTFTGVTTNAGEVEIMGLEWEGFGVLGSDAFVAGDEFTLSWSLGLLDGEYKQFINAFGVDVSDQASLQNTPDTTGSLQLAYSAPLHGGELSVVNSLFYKGDVQQFEFASPIDQEAYTLWNLSAVWESGSGQWQLGVHGRNLTDERYKVAGYDFVTSSTLGLEGTLTAFYGDPRTVTATVTYRY